MAKKMVISLIVILACTLLLAGLLLSGPLLTANALAANGFAITRGVIGGGGAPLAGGDYILHGTVGEPIVSGFSQGGTYGSSSGFWSPPEYRIYLPLVMR